MSTATATKPRIRGKRPLKAGPVPADEGIVVAVVAVTGTDDHVGDVIAPGAFSKTLKRRRPKLAFNHDWADPLGRVLHITELMPGDARLPKKLPDGRPWPRAAGAVIATMQFHMGTMRGREIFEHTKQWALAGEAAFSIGYKATPGRAAKRADGVRIIYELELYEISVVLHGAHDMALALEVKGLRGAGDGQAPVALDTLTGPQGLTTVVDQDTRTAAAPDFTGSAMLALMVAPDAAAALAVDGGLPAGELHITLAYLGDADTVDTAGLIGQLTPALAGAGPLSGQAGGLGVFPPGDTGVPVWVPVDVPGLDALRVTAVNALAAAGHPQKSEHGYTPHITIGYDLPTVDPAPPTPVEFTHAVLVVGTEHHMIPLTAAPMEGKSAAWAVRSARAFAPANIERKTAASVVLEAKSLPPTQETKTMNRLAGSHEELRENLNRAVDALFEKPKPPTGDGTATEPGSCSWIEATFDDHVVVTHTDYSKGPEDREETFVVPYSIDTAGKVTLGEPEAAQINVTLATGDEDATVLDADDAAAARFTLPLADMLHNASTLALLAPEGKGLEDDVRPALDTLLATLAAKGLPYSPDVEGDDEDWDALAAELDAGVDDDEDAGDAPVDLPPEDDDMVMLDPAELDADMAELEDTHA